MRLTNNEQRIREIDTDKLRNLDENLHLSDLEDAGPARHRLVRPSVGTLQGKAPPEPTKQVHSPPRKTPNRPAQRKAASPPIEVPSASSESEPEPPAKRMPPPAPPAKKTRGRPRKKQTLQRAASYGSAAGEGASSSPPPTQADMSLGTQQRLGEDLGSQDTSGEDEEEEPGSDDLAFIARSSEANEMRSSSQPLPTIDDPSSSDEDEEEQETPKRVVRRRRVVADSDEDE